MNTTQGYTVCFSETLIMEAISGLKSFGGTATSATVAKLEIAVNNMNTQSTIKRYIAIAKAVGSYHRCVESGNTEWQAKHKKAIEKLCADLPSGSGFDRGSHIDLDQSTGEKLVFNTSYHHMDDGGFYDGWTEHEVVLTPSLEMGYRLKVTGTDRNEIKDYIHEQFSYTLDNDVEQWSGYPAPKATTNAA